MSTLKVATIQDTSGNNSSTPEQVAQGRAKAWVNFNGTGTVAIRDDFNVSSITDESTGAYKINFTNAMANANYCAVVSTGTTFNLDAYVYSNTYSPPYINTGFIRVNIRYSSSDAFHERDCEHVFAAIFGD